MRHLNGSGALIGKNGCRLHENVQSGTSVAAFLVGEHGCRDSNEAIVQILNRGLGIITANEYNAMGLEFSVPHDLGGSVRLYTPRHCQCVGRSVRTQHCQGGNDALAERDAVHLSQIGKVAANVRMIKVFLSIFAERAVWFAGDKRMTSREVFKTKVCLFVLIVLVSRVKSPRKEGLGIGLASLFVAVHLKLKRVVVKLEGFGNIHCFDRVQASCEQVHDRLEKHAPHP